MKFSFNDFLELDTKGLLAVNGGFDCCSVAGSSFPSHFGNHTISGGILGGNCGIQSSLRELSNDIPSECSASTICMAESSVSQKKLQSIYETTVNPVVPISLLNENSNMNFRSESNSLVLLKTSY